MPRNHSALPYIATLLVLVSGSVSALIQPEAQPLRAKTFRALEMNIASLFLTEKQLAVQAKAPPFGDLESLGLGLASGSDAGYLDPRSGRWGTLMPAVPLLPAEAGLPAREAFLAWLGDHAAGLGIDMTELAQPKLTEHRDGALIQIYTPRVVGGVLVQGSYLHAVINHGNLVLFGAIKWGDVTTSPVPSLSSSAARNIADAHLGELADVVAWSKRQLIFVPTAVGSDPRTVPVGRGYSYRLAWALWGKSSGASGASGTGSAGEWQALVDAHDGTLLAFEDLLSYASTREVVGGVLPLTNDGSDPGGIEQIYPIPFTNLTVGEDTHFTGSSGSLLACLDGTIESNLDGPYIMIADDCGATSESTTGDVLDFGTNPGTDCSTPAGASPGNTRSARSAFYELNRLMEIGRSYLPSNQFLQNNLRVNVNVVDTCNAMSGADQLDFYRSGGGCSNTGEIAGVFDHEWGHSMDRGDATPGLSNPGEGIADIYAALRLNTSCIGFNFRPGVLCAGYGDACTECTGVRDIDWEKRDSGLPHDLAFIDAACGTGAGTPCGGSTHCEGAVYGEAVWDLWKRDLTAAPFSLDDPTAQTLLMRLTFEASGGVDDWFTCIDGAGVGDGCNADSGYLNYLAADDDDGNLNNGTPHMDAIFDAFDRHGIACPTPMVTTSGCGNRPISAPTVSTTSTDHAALIEWTPVPDAATYQVLRSEGVFGCAFGKKLLAVTPELRYFDTELENGTDYYYSVVPVGVGGDSCVGPASACTTVTPAAGANPQAKVETADFTILTGDGDGFFDSCERATVVFDVENIGVASMTNARIADVRAIDHPGVEASIRNFGVFAASLEPCATAQASFDFRGVEIEFGETLVFEVDITSDELGALVRTATLSLGDVESDFEVTPSIIFSFETGREGWQTLSGTFDPSTAVGGAGGSAAAMNSSSFLDDQCDRVRSPLFVPTAATTLTLATHYEIEDMSMDQWWDRANVSTVDSFGARTVVAPSTGRAYDASPDTFEGCNSDEAGWAGTATGATWVSSHFSATDLGSAALAGQEVQVEVVYSTDASAVERGFAFDRVRLTNVEIQVEDAQDDCSIELFADGFETGDTQAWSATLN